MNQNALGQSDCRIFKLNIHLAQNDEIVYFCMLIQIKSSLKNIWVGVVKYGCSHSGHTALKLAVFKSVSKKSME